MKLPQQTSYTNRKLISGDQLLNASTVVWVCIRIGTICDGIVSTCTKGSCCTQASKCTSAEWQKLRSPLQRVYQHCPSPIRLVSIEHTPRADRAHTSCRSSAHLVPIECTPRVDQVHTSCRSSTHLVPMKRTPRVVRVHNSFRTSDISHKQGRHLAGQLQV